MRWRNMMILSIALIVGSAGCGLQTVLLDTEEAKAMTDGAVPYEVVKEPYPTDVNEVLKVVKQTGGLRVVSTPYNNYIVIALGEKRTAGYSITVQSVEKRSDHILVTYHVREPGPNDITAQVITYPYIVLSIPTTDLPVRFQRV